jgi:hypothetical protein
LPCRHDTRRRCATLAALALRPSGDARCAACCFPAAVPRRRWLLDRALRSAAGRHLTTFERIDTVAGTGTEAVPGSKVTVHYTGWIYDNRTETKHGKTFDSSFGTASRSPSRSAPARSSAAGMRAWPA